VFGHASAASANGTDLFFVYKKTNPIIKAIAEIAGQTSIRTTAVKRT
jgi:hypothetical protein